MSGDGSKDAEIGDAGAAIAEKTPAESAPKSKKEKKPKKKYAATRPPCMDMITEALSNLGDKNGSSVQAIKRYIAWQFGCEMDSKMTWYVRQALNRGVANGKLIQTTGTGASGCFKLGSLAETVSKPTKRQIASAEAAAKIEAKAKADAKRLAKKSKKKSRGRLTPAVTQKKSAKRPAAKKSVKKPAAKKVAKPSKTVSKRSGRKGRK